MEVGLHLCIDAPLIRIIDFLGWLVLLSITWSNWAHGSRAVLSSLASLRRRRRCWLDFDTFDHCEVHHLLPLCEYEVVLFKVFTKHLH